MYKVTHRHDFVSQKKCAHSRLLVCEHAHEHVW